MVIFPLAYAQQGTGKLQDCLWRGRSVCLDEGYERRLFTVNAVIFQIWKGNARPIQECNLTSTLGAKLLGSICCHLCYPGQVTQPWNLNCMKRGAISLFRFCSSSKTLLSQWGMGRKQMILKKGYERSTSATFCKTRQLVGTGDFQTLFVRS